MKKICLLLICIFVLTGCSSKTEDFNKTCSQKVKSSGIVNTEKMKVNFNNKDEVTNVVVTRTYKAQNEDGVSTLKDIKESASGYNNELAKSKSIKIAVALDNDEEYVIKYYLDVQKMTEDELDIFKLKKNSVKFFNKMRTSNIECK